MIIKVTRTKNVVIMSIEMQRLLLKEIQEELSNIDRILNDDCDKVSKECEKKLIKIHNIICEEL